MTHPSSTSSPSKSNLVLFVVVALIIGACAFYGGMKYQETRSPVRNMMFQGRNGMGNFAMAGAGGPRMGGQGGAALFRGQRGDSATNGEIQKIENGMLTLKQMDGSSKIIIMSTSTRIMQTTEADPDALKASTSVMVFGTANPDGSITASSVQIRPAMPASAPDQKK